MEDFLLASFDLQSLFSESLNAITAMRLCVAWNRIDQRKAGRVQRLADVLEPVHTVLEMGVGCVDVFRVVSSFQDSQGDLISEWEAVLGDLTRPGLPFVGARFVSGNNESSSQNDRRPGVGGRSFRCEGSRAARSC